MGAAESREGMPGGVEGIVTINAGAQAAQAADPTLETLRTLRPMVPILRMPPDALKDILSRRLGSQSSQPSSGFGTIDLRTTADLFAVFEDWCRGTAAHVGRKQEEIHNGIDVVEALAVKLLQRLNYSAGVMKISAEDLQEVNSLQSDIGELKKELRTVLQSYDKLCKRIEDLRRPVEEQKPAEGKPGEERKDS